MRQFKSALSLIFMASLFFLASCKKDKTPGNGNETINSSQVLYTGVLTGGEAGDEARGNVSIEKSGTKYYLVFKNFTSNAGPDVHIYLSKTIGTHAVPPTEYQDLGFMKFTSGTFNYELAAEPDIVNYKYALVWCAQYRIQFGYAELK